MHKRRHNSQKGVLQGLLALAIANDFSARIGRTFQDLLLSKELERGGACFESLFSSPGDHCWNEAEEVLAEAERDGVSTTHILDENYPLLLRTIADPPLVLFVKSLRGGLAAELWPPLGPAEGAGIGIVGSRACSDDAARFARRLGYAAAEHALPVVSGLARGVDQAAHEGAINGVRATSARPIDPFAIAVLGCGVARVYPAENQRLAEAIVEEGGLLLSEYGVSSRPKRWYFPQRNRIISALSTGVVVVEARRRSGALITARLALEQGRDVFAVPGRVGVQSAGTNHLLKEGAAVLTEISDLAGAVLPIDHFWRARPEKGAPSAVQAVEPGAKDGERDPDLRAVVLLALEQMGAGTLDELGYFTNVAAHRLCEVLGELELQGRVFRVPGGRYARLEFVDT